MAGLILLLILIPAVIIILIVSINSKVSSQQQMLNAMYEKLNQAIHQLNELSKKKKETPAESPAQQPVMSPPEIKKDIIPEKEVQPEPAAAPVMELKKEVKPAAEIINTKQEELAFVEENLPRENKPGKTNTDIEKFIGENLANKIGIAVLVLGIAFFVKYAIDKNWVQEAGRVIIGLISGGVLMLFAHRIRNSYRPFSSVLTGGALTVFYFTIAFAFHQYHLIDQQTAFFIMVLITALGVAMSLFYDRLELSILATVGGFITPFLVSTGQDNYTALFTYLCILNGGLMVLAWFKRWPAINFIALFFTIIIYGGWMTKRMLFNYPPDLPYKAALLFASLFYLQFITMNVINNLRLKRTFTALDFIVVLSINFLYYAAGMLALEYWDNGRYQGLFTGLLAVFNLLLTVIFYRNKNVDRNFIYLLIGLMLSFASLFAPVQLHGNHITLFWAAEMVALFWLYRRSGIGLMKIASLFVTVFMLISLLIDWSDIYFSENIILPVFINKGFITSLTVVVALFIYQAQVRRQANSYYLKNITNRLIRNWFLAGSVIILYLTGVLEIYYQFGTRYELPINLMYLQLYTFLFTIILLQVFRQSGKISLLRIALTIYCLVFYLLSIRGGFDLSFAISGAENTRPHFLAHWIAAILLFKLLCDLVAFFRKNQAAWSAYQSSFTWLCAGSMIILLSVEAYHILIWTNYHIPGKWPYAENLFYKAGLTILWAVCSFIMMWLGMKYRFRTLRIISLTLFTGILFKLFTYDISNIPPGGKIAAFILLGILLLIVSFMYQRLKKIIIDNTDEEK